MDMPIQEIYDSVAYEKDRAVYPENFPALPEIPVGRYSDPAFYALEMQHLWRKSWLHAGHISELPQPGSYKLFEQVGLSIIVTRNLEGEIKAFHNICRHRGSALLLESKGTARRFVCPYHAWGYSIDGKLVSVPEQQDFACLDKKERGLLPVRCETMRGMIFITLDPDAEPLERHFAATLRQIGDFPLEDMVVKHIVHVDMACNWKTAYDNFLEIYHVATVHAKSIAPYLDSKSFSVALYKNGHARFATRKRGAQTIFGEDLSMPEGPSPVFKDHTIGLPMFPNGFTAIDPVGFTWQTWWPVGPKKTVMVGSLMGWKDDSEADKKFWEGMKVQVNDIVNEDQLLFAQIQRTYDSGILPSIVVSSQERALYWYQEEVDRRIGIENIPEHLRIRQVLAGHTND